MIVFSLMSVSLRDSIPEYVTLLQNRIALPPAGTPPHAPSQSTADSSDRPPPSPATRRRDCPPSASSEKPSRPKPDRGIFAAKPVRPPLPQAPAASRILSLRAKADRSLDTPSSSPDRSPH